MYQHSVPQKKKNTGRTVGIVIGVIFLLAALVVGGLYFVNHLSQPSSPSTPVVEPGGPVEPVEPVVPVVPSDPNFYSNDKIGISLTLEKGWEAVESDDYPSEVLGIYSDNSNDAVVWIDRYPQFNLEDFEYDTIGWLSLYADENEGATFKIITDEEVRHDGLTWRHVVFTATDTINEVYVDLYLTDMPDKRGLFLYAVIAPLNNSGQTVFPGLDSGLKMFESLQFTKVGQQTASVTVIKDSPGFFL